MSGAAASFVGGAATIAVALAPSSVSGRYAGGGTFSVPTGSVIATPSGGIAPYTYSWAALGTSAYTWTISAAASATTSFTCVNLPEGVVATRDFELTVTDAAGSTGKATVHSTCRNNNDLSGGGGGGL